MTWGGGKKKRKKESNFPSLFLNRTVTLAGPPIDKKTWQVHLNQRVARARAHARTHIITRMPPPTATYEYSNTSWGFRPRDTQVFKLTGAGGAYVYSHRFVRLKRFLLPSDLFYPRVSALIILHGILHSATDMPE